MRCTCRVHNPESFRGWRGAAGGRARRDILHGCVGYLSSCCVNAYCERRDQAERQKFEFFHKSLRLLNITKLSSLQALTETRSKLFGHLTKFGSAEIPRISLRFFSHRCL